MIEPLPELSTAELETLLAALDPLLDGFGEGGSCLDDASAFLERLGIAQHSDEGGTTSPLLQWLESWRAAGGNRTTLRLMVQTLLTGRQEDLPD
ncbi:hypothetical protein [Synechococcus sp. BA-132 BA5]|uniref:hypothetical protein n=1 Tax=Synechococcus sp. BA-132 BA5 TaxID=3110252 RepID=UPI002B1FF5C9|nr:hypothetical protein [Synechococcus sp. BA-132 BA5]MEA5415463.1 hypothetical protein [Synechococcus sp. BA-132 BA5]